MLFGVVGQVASLAPVPEVVERAVLWRVVKMTSCEYDLRSCNRMRLAIGSTTVWVCW